MILRALLLLYLLPLSVLLKAQNAVTSDDLFKAARTAAFDEKNDDKAKQLAKQALLQSPQYADIEVFLGRLYAWNKQYDSAVYHFQNVISYAAAHADASIAYTDIEYWNDHYIEALEICNKALSSHPQSPELLLRKAKILNALKQYKEASIITNGLIKSNNHNTAALALASSLRDAASVNKIGVDYNYTYFDKQLNDPWHMASLSYSRQTSLGSVTSRLNYANRFSSNGLQFEIDAYPKINRIFYSYISVGFAGRGIFPKYRAGFSLYANLPRSFEAEAGLRYLNFGSSTYVYTAYLGKYVSNYLLGVRTYVTPGSNGASQSYSFLGRYYFNGAEDYLGLSVGSGISPDDRTLNIQFSNKNRLKSRKASLNFNHSFSKYNILSLSGGWVNQERSTMFSGNQYDVAIGIQRRF
jgi:YaiO family outer membrane protein